MKTKHFAAVIGAAGIMVGPFVTTVAAHADDSVAVDPAPSIVDGGEPELVFLAGSEAQTVGDAIVGGDAAELAPIVSQAPGASNAASTGILIVGDADVIIPFDVLPEDVITALPAPGVISEADYAKALAAIAPYAIAEDEDVLAAELLASGQTDVMVSLPFGGEIEWTVVAADLDLAAAPEGFVEVVPPASVEAPEAASAVAEAPAESLAAGPSIRLAPVSVAAVDGASVAVDDVAPAGSTKPMLPTTGVGSLSAGSLAKTGGIAPLGAILLAGSLMGSGVGLTRIRTRKTED